MSSIPLQLPNMFSKVIITYTFSLLIHYLFQFTPGLAGPLGAPAANDVSEHEECL